MKRILIVDDDVDIVDLVKNRLEANNYEVEISNNGYDGLKKAIETQPDLIILDVMMPKLSGDEAIKFLKSDPRTKDIPIFFFTALASNTDDDKVLTKINLGGTLYPALAKPFDPNQLLSVIKSLLGENKRS